VKYCSLLPIFWSFFVEIKCLKFFVLIIGVVSLLYPELGEFLKGCSIIFLFISILFTIIPVYCGLLNWSWVAWIMKSSY